MNLIELPASHEHLRDTIFYNLFHNSIIFDDFTNATAYRREIVSHGMRVSNIYTLTGERIGSSGVFDPSSKNKLPRALPIVFGQMPMRSTNDFDLLEKGMCDLEHTYMHIENKYYFEVLFNIEK